MKKILGCEKDVGFGLVKKNHLQSNLFKYQILKILKVMLDKLSLYFSTAPE